MYPGHHATTTPDRPAIVMAGSGESVSYRQLDEASNRLAHWLRAQGLRTGDHIAILAENNPRYFEVYWAALRSGLYITAINRFLSPEEAAFIVNDSNSSVLVTTLGMAETAAGMADLIPRCQKRLMMDETAPGFDSYEEAVAAMPTEPLAEQPAGDVMLYSSGTTGRPEGYQAGVERPADQRSGTLEFDHAHVLSAGDGRELRLSLAGAAVSLSTFAVVRRHA